MTDATFHETAMNVGTAKNVGRAIVQRLGRRADRSALADRKIDAPGVALAA